MFRAYIVFKVLKVLGTIVNPKLSKHMSNKHLVKVGYDQINH